MDEQTQEVHSDPATAQLALGRLQRDRSDPDCQVQSLPEVQGDALGVSEESRELLADLLLAVNALPGAGGASQYGKSYYVRLDDVMDLIEGSMDAKEK